MFSGQTNDIKNAKGQNIYSKPYKNIVQSKDELITDENE